MAFEFSASLLEMRKSQLFYKSTKLNNLVNKKKLEWGKRAGDDYV